MKVIAINGSPRKDGNTNAVLEVMAEELKKEGVEVEIIHIGHLVLPGCIACGYCATSIDNQCIFKNDIVNEVAKKMREADGLILGSPTYYAGIAGTMKSFLDRVFYSSSKYFKYKIATSVSVVRRAGGVDVVHQLNNYLQLAQTILPPSQYWTTVYGTAKKEVLHDSEGIQTVRMNARTMAWILKKMDASKNIPFPKEEKRIRTNFIRGE